MASYDSGIIDLSQPVHEWRILKFGELIQKKKIVTSPKFKMEENLQGSRWRMHLMSINSLTHNFYVLCKLENTKKIEGFVAMTFHIYNKGTQKESFQSYFSFRKTKVSISLVQLAIINYITKDDFMKYFHNPKASYSLTIPFSFYNSDYRFVGNDNLYDDIDIIEVKAKDLDLELSVTKKLHFFDDYKILFNDKRFSDVVIKVDGKTIDVHKCILSIKSPVFNSMFKHDMIEQKTSTIIISDIKYEILLEMLRFLYAGEVKNMKNIAVDLFYVADKYQIEALRSECVDKLVENLSVDNVIGYLKLADRHSVNELKNEAIAFIVDNAKNIVDSAEFQELASQNRIFFDIFKIMALKTNVTQK